MRKYRLIIGIICIAVSIWMLLADKPIDNPSPAIIVMMIGILLIGITRRKK